MKLLYCPHCKKAFEPDPTGACSACGKEIDQQAAVAAQQWVQSGCLLLILLAGAVLGTTCLWSQFFGDPAPEGPTEFDAVTMAEDFVSSHLKAPSTAEFSGYGETDVIGNGNTWTVVGWVDAQSQFGAMLRHKYVCQMIYEGENRWRLLNLEMNERQ